MKLLTLTVTDIENVTAEYDFTAGNIRSPEEAIRFLEYALFGNDVLFDGKIILTVQNYGDTYKIERDFATGTTVYKNDLAVGAEEGETIIAKIAGLKQSSWKVNALVADNAGFYQNPSKYIKGFLAELGLDKEELENRWNYYYKDHSRYVSKVEAYDELVDDSYQQITADKKAKYEALQKELDAMTFVKQSAEEKDLLLSLKSSLTEKKNALLQNSADIEEKRILIQKDDATKAKIAEINQNNESADTEKYMTALNETQAEIDALTKQRNEKEKELLAKAGEVAGHSERAAGLRDSFEEILQNNLSDMELTQAVLAKTEGVVATVEEEEDPITAELKSTHLNYLKRRAYREGVAFENNFDNSNLRIADLSTKIEQNTVLMERLQAEIDGKPVVEIDPKAEESIDSIDKTQRAMLYEAKFVARKLEKEIADSQDKIRSLAKQIKHESEDITALKKAKSAQEEYNRRCEELLLDCNRQILANKSRTSFVEDETELSVGDVCPVCKNNLIMNLDATAEYKQLTAEYEQLTETANEIETWFNAGKEKLLKIELRITQLTERCTMNQNTVEELKKSLSTNQVQLSKILANHNAITVSDLEKQYRYAPLASTEISIKEHVNFLKTQLEELTATVATDKNSLQEEKDRLSAMQKAYEIDIKPSLDGQNAFEQLDELVKNDIREDELIAKLGSVQNTENADIFVNVTAEIFADVMSEIKKSEYLRQIADNECYAIGEQMKELENNVAKLQATADALKIKIEESGNIEAIDTSSLEAELLDETVKNNLVAEVTKYDDDLNALSIQISALEGYNEVEFDNEEYIVLAQKVKEAEEDYNKSSARLTVSEAAKELAYENSDICKLLSFKMATVKDIADGEIFNVVMPIINEVVAGDNLEARPDGNEISFYKNNGKQIALENVDESILALATNCALNYVLQLATGEETTRFVIGKHNVPTEIAEKYGVVVL